jgi:hypothetical protein
VTDGAGFVRELCIALEHRWQPEELFLLFTAYLDEADTHGPAPTVIMGGFLGTARQWEIFDRRLRALQRRDGFNIFHVKELKSRSGEFAGWADEKCMRLIHDLAALVRDTLAEGLTVHLERDRYLNEYRAPPVPKKMILDSQYGVCFRACMRQLLDIVMADGKRHRLHIVIEKGHVNLGDTIRIFDDLKRRLKVRRGLDVLGTITAARKHEAAPLMVADFLASSYSMIRASQQRGGIDYAAETPAPRKREAGLTFLELLPDALRRLKEDFEADRREAAEAWRSRRAARILIPSEAADSAEQPA